MNDIIDFEKEFKDKQVKAGKAIVARAERCIWDIGKWFSKMQDALHNNAEVIAKGKKVVTSQPFSLKDICEEVGVSYPYASQAANIYKLFGSDTYNLPFNHYVTILPLVKVQGEEVARQMLLSSQKGERFDGEFEDYGYGKPWRHKDIQRAVKIAMGKLSIDAPTPTKIDIGQANVMKEITSSLKQSSVPMKDINKVKSSVERGIKATFNELKNDFQDHVDKAVKERFQREFGNLSSELKERQQNLDDVEQRLIDYQSKVFSTARPINSLMTEKEFNALRSFVHPDKNAGNEKQAEKVFLIVQKLRESFTTANLSKKDLELQGWKKK